MLARLLLGFDHDFDGVVAAVAGIADRLGPLLKREGELSRLYRRRFGARIRDRRNVCSPSVLAD
jgi:hypothetical protein